MKKQVFQISCLFVCMVLLIASISFSGKSKVIQAKAADSCWETSGTYQYDKVHMYSNVGCKVWQIDHWVFLGYEQYCSSAYADGCWVVFCDENTVGRICVKLPPAD